jgi:hypothetical protein
MVFLPDGRALLVERQKGVDLLDVKSGAVTPLEGGPEALIGTIPAFTTPTALRL